MTRHPNEALLLRLLGAAQEAPEASGSHAKPRKGRKPSDAPSAPTAPLIVSVDALPPSVNHMYVTIRGGGRALTSEARAWYDYATAAIKAGAAGYAVPAGPLKLTIVLYALPRSRDLDNALKASQDALAKALGFDDKRIDYLAVARGAGKPARTVYTLEAL